MEYQMPGTPKWVEWAQVKNECSSILHRLLYPDTAHGRFQVPRSLIAPSVVKIIMAMATSTHSDSSHFRRGCDPAWHQMTRKVTLNGNMWNMAGDEFNLMQPKRYRALANTALLLKTWWELARVKGWLLDRRGIQRPEVPSASIPPVSPNKWVKP